MAETNKFPESGNKTSLVVLFGTKVLGNSSENVTLKKEAYLHSTNDVGVETVVESANSAKNFWEVWWKAGLGLRNSWPLPSHPSSYLSFLFLLAF